MQMPGYVRLSLIHVQVDIMRLLNIMTKPWILDPEDITALYSRAVTLHYLDRYDEGY